jgi:hypothetical protein
MRKTVMNVLTLLALRQSANAENIEVSVVAEGYSQAHGVITQRSRIVITGPQGGARCRQICQRNQVCRVVIVVLFEKGFAFILFCLCTFEAIKQGYF